MYSWLRPERRRKTREMAWKGIQQYSKIIDHRTYNEKVYASFHFILNRRSCVANTAERLWSAVGHVLLGHLVRTSYSTIKNKMRLRIFIYPLIATQ